MRVVLIFRVTTQVPVEEAIQRAIYRREPCIPVAVMRIDTREDVLWLMTEIVGLTVALVLVVPQLIACLQMRSLPKRLTVGQIEHITTIIAGRTVVSGRVVGRVLASNILDTEQMHFIVRSALLLVIACAALHTEGNIPAFGIQSAEQLQHSPGILVLSVRETGLTVIVYQIGV